MNNSATTHTAVAVAVLRSLRNAGNPLSRERICTAVCSRNLQRLSLFAEQLEVLVDHGLVTHILGVSRRDYSITPDGLRALRKRR